jgi:membrane peptidoglycan carboxypeptidase
MKPMLITRITDRDGNVIEENRPQARDAIRADTAYLMTSLLRGVVERVRRNQFKRMQPPIAKLSNRTIGYDFLYLRDWGT